MGTITDTAKNVWRDYDVIDDPKSNPHYPIKAEIRNLFGLVDSATTGFGAGRKTLRDFGAVGDWNGSTGTDDSAAINAATAFLRSQELGSYYKYWLDGEGLTYLHNTSLNFTGFNAGRACGFINARFHSRCTGKPALDFGDSRFLFLDRLYVEGDATNIPSAAYQFYRVDDGGGIPFTPAGTHDIGDLSAFGTFSQAAAIFLASEVNHVKGLHTSNNYWNSRACCVAVVGHSDILLAHFGSQIVSDYVPIGLGEQSQSTFRIDYNNPQRGVAYTYAIVSMSKANPCVVTIAPADAATAAASYGLANGQQIFIPFTGLVGSDFVWRNAFGGRTFAISSLNTGAGTFTVPVDTTGFAGSFTSGAISNDTGPAMVLGNLKNFFDGEASYKVAYSKAKVKYYMTGGNNENRHVFIGGHFEPATEHVIEIVGDATAGRKIRGLTLRDDHGVSVTSPVLISGCSGLGDVRFEDIDWHFGQNPQGALKTITNQDFCEVLGGRIFVPDDNMIQSRNSFKGALFQGQWHGPNGPLNRRSTRFASLTRTSITAIASDPALDMALLANMEYSFKVLVTFDSPPAAGFKFGLTAPASPTQFRWAAMWINPDGAIGQVARAADETTGIIIAPWVTNINGGQLTIEGTLLNTTAGTLGFSWAQAVSNVGTTSVRIGSYIEVFH